MCSQTSLKLYRILDRVSHGKYATERILAWEDNAFPISPSIREQVSRILEKELSIQPIAKAYERIESKTRLSLPFLRKHADPEKVAQIISEESSKRENHSIYIPETELKLQYHLLDSYLVHVEKSIKAVKGKLEDDLFNSIINAYGINPQLLITSTQRCIDHWKKRVRQNTEEDSELEEWNVKFVNT